MIPFSLTPRSYTAKVLGNRCWYWLKTAQVHIVGQGQPMLCLLGASSAWTWRPAKGLQRERREWPHCSRAEFRRWVLSSIAFIMPVFLMFNSGFQHSASPSPQLPNPLPRLSAKHKASHPFRVTHTYSRKFWLLKSLSVVFKGNIDIFQLLNTQPSVVTVNGQGDGHKHKLTAISGWALCLSKASIGFEDYLPELLPAHHQYLF